MELKIGTHILTTPILTLHLAMLHCEIPLFFVVVAVVAVVAIAVLFIFVYSIHFRIALALPLTDHSLLVNRSSTWGLCRSLVNLWILRFVPE